MRAIAIALFALVACGDNIKLAPDAAKPDSPPPFAEAAHPNVPVVVSGGGPVLATPKVQPIFFTGDDAQLQMQGEQFLTQLGTSEFWSKTTAEYGVGPIMNLPTIVTSDTAPTTQAGMVTWLESKFDGTHIAEGWPATPDPSTIYTVFLTQAATTTYAGACQQYLAY